MQYTVILRQYVTYTIDEYAHIDVEAASPEGAEERVQAAIDSDALYEEFGIEWQEGDDQDNGEVVLEPEVVSVDPIELPGQAARP